jgi:wyosine [tRNA(Phe)-imidazoG37] synthetase (radical SAM superfamily)
MPHPAHDHITYGPVPSRRLGRSLGINLLPTGMKVCNISCAYCQYGFTHEKRPHRVHGWPAPPEVETALRLRLRRALDEGERLDRITVAGHGEPTLHPEFEEVADRVRRVRDQLTPEVRLAILSNSTTAGWPDVQRALERFEERYMKLDAGDPITYARINGPGPSIAEIVDALGDLPGVMVQAMFVADPGGRVDNTTDAAVSEWLAALARVNPERVHLYTIDRHPALEYLRPAPAPRLRAIAEQVREIGFEAEVFPS